MSPVAPSRARNPRNLVIGLAGVVLGIVAVIVVFVFAVPSLTESGKVKVQLGSDTWQAGRADKRAAAVRRDGPLLFSDPTSGERDIFLQHLGDDDNSGWLAFEARKVGQGRECTLKWDGTSQFNDPCDGTHVPADGQGLVQLKVVVTDGQVVVDLRPDAARGGDTTVPPSSTTTTIGITGTIPR